MLHCMRGKKLKNFTLKFHCCEKFSETLEICETFCETFCEIFCDIFCEIFCKIFCEMPVLLKELEQRYTDAFVKNRRLQALHCIFWTQSWLPHLRKLTYFVFQIYPVLKFFLWKLKSFFQYIITEWINTLEVFGSKCSQFLDVLIFLTQVSYSVFTGTCCCGRRKAAYIKRIKGKWFLQWHDK